MLDFAECINEGLSQADGFSDPFRVFYFRPFSDEFFGRIIAHLPDDKFFQYMMHADARRADGTSTRLVLNLSKPERIEALPKYQREFWSDTQFHLSGPRVETVFRKYLSLQGNLFPTLMLLRDLRGYRIKPHPDAPVKAATVQFYLPSNDKRPHLGTSFYRRNASGELVLLRTLEYVRNSAYAFKVTAMSWHGTEFDDIVEPRDSLMLVYYKQPFDGY